MATWSLLQSLTNFDFTSVCSDGSNIYFVQYGGGASYQVFKYDTALDTVTQISNAASFSGTTPQLISAFPGGNSGGSAIQWFGSNLYVGIFTADANNMRIYRYDGSGTSWTEVLATTNPGGRWSLCCTSSHLIIIPSNDSLSGIADNDLVTWAKYSSDGSSWSNATVSNTPAYISTGFGLSWSRGAAVYGQGVSPIVSDLSSHSTFEPDPDARVRWFQWSAGTFSITHYAEANGAVWTPSDTWYRTGSKITDVFFWWFDSSIWKYVAALGDSFITPSNHFQNGAEIYPIVTINFTEQQGGDCNGDFTLMAEGAWSTSIETVGSGGLSHLVKMSDGDGFLFGATGAQAAIWGRSEPFPVAGPTGSGTLYVYKTVDNGLNWSTRKVET